MNNEIDEAIEDSKKYIRDLTQAESEAHFSQQKEQYEEEHDSFISAYKKDKCYMCNKAFSTISKDSPCLHWLLRRGKFKKKDYKLVYENFNYYQTSTFLRWVSHAETASKNINNLIDESSDRKIFETTIKWKNIEWTLDCSRNDFKGHEGTKTDFPHWHLQMRIDQKQFIKFNDFHIPLSKRDQVQLRLEEDESSGYEYTYGYGGMGMQETMDNVEADFDMFMERAKSDQEQGFVRVQSIIAAPDGISGSKIDEAMKMHQKTGKNLQYCFSKVLEAEKGISMQSLVSPAETVPEIAKRTERKRR